MHPFSKGICAKVNLFSANPAPQALIHYISITSRKESINLKFNYFLSEIVEQMPLASGVGFRVQIKAKISDDGKNSLKKNTKKQTVAPPHFKFLLLVVVLDEFKLHRC